MHIFAGKKWARLWNTSSNKIEQFVWKRLPLLTVSCSRVFKARHVSDIATFPLISGCWGAFRRLACQVDVLAILRLSLDGTDRNGRCNYRENKQIWHLKKTTSLLPTTTRIIRMWWSRKENKNAHNYGNSVKGYLEPPASLCQLVSVCHRRGSGHDTQTPCCPPGWWRIVSGQPSHGQHRHPVSFGLRTPV